MSLPLVRREHGLAMFILMVRDEARLQVVTQALERLCIEEVDAEWRCIGGVRGRVRHAHAMVCCLSAFRASARLCLTANHKHQRDERVITIHLCLDQKKLPGYFWYGLKMVLRLISCQPCVQASA